MNAIENLVSIFSENASRILFVAENGHAITYLDAWNTALAVRHALTKQGAREGARIAMILPNSEHMPILYLACAMGGFVACPVDPSLPASRTQQIFHQIEPSIIVDPALLNTLFATPADPQTLPAPAFSLNGEFLIVLSSGTTGVAKGIIHSLSNILLSAASFARLSELGPNSVVYSHFPMFYMAGIFNLFFCPLLAAARIIIGPQFSPLAMLSFWDRPLATGVNHLTLTPTMANSLAHIFRDRGNALEKIQKFEAIISTSSTLNNSIAQRFLDTFSIPLRSCYGVTELGGSITLQSWEEALAMDSVGLIEGGNSQCKAGLSNNMPAEIRIKTPFMMKGYLGNGDTSSPFDAEGFFATGDIGYMERGRLYVTGRESDLIKRGGEFISIQQIECIALQCNLISDAAVVSTPEEFWGNKLTLFYVPAPGISAEHEPEILFELSALFNEQLKHLEIPEKIIPVPWLPKTPIGKTIKRALAEKYTI